MSSKIIISNFIVKAINGEFNHTDFEVFIMQFLCLKQHLFSLILERKSMTMRELLPGAYMSDIAVQLVIEWNEKQLFEFVNAKKPATNPDNLYTEGPFSKQITIKSTDKSYSIHIGKCDEQCNGLLTVNGQTSVLLEMKYSENNNQIRPFDGIDKNSFIQELKKANESNLHLSNKFFVYVTNVWIDKMNCHKELTLLVKQLNEMETKHNSLSHESTGEIDKELRKLKDQVNIVTSMKEYVDSVMGDCSAIIHAGNWRDTLSSTFFFINPLE